MKLSSQTRLSQARLLRWSTARLLSAQLVLGVAALGVIPGSFNLAIAQQESGAEERETRRTPALRNKVYEKLAEAQAAAEAKDLNTAASVL
ncbi:MAG: hypothetical protein AAF749_03815, partial [Pseudomonadota bacterium]